LRQTTLATGATFYAEFPIGSGAHLGLANADAREAAVVCDPTMPINSV